jgi:hypothetical protein
MTFATECISFKDRERYRRADFENQFFIITTQDDWAADRWQNLFLRAICPATRGSEPGDPDARSVKDFPFHWKSLDYFTCLRVVLGVEELRNWPGEILIVFIRHVQGEEVLRINLHTGEMCVPGARSAASKISRQQVLTDDEYAFAFNFVGVFQGHSSEEAESPRHTILSVAPKAEVTA